jgi:hypothetical protein
MKVLQRKYDTPENPYIHMYTHTCAKLDGIFDIVWPPRTRSMGIWGSGRQFVGNISAWLEEYGSMERKVVAEYHTHSASDPRLQAMVRVPIPPVRHHWR